MFVDEQEIRVQAGEGGDGIVSFRRERYIPFGGPDGGDGGDGGDVLLIGSKRFNTLGHLHSKNLHRAQNGQNGSGQNKKGKRGMDCIIRVPLGTIVKDPTTGEALAEIETEGQTVLLAQGSKGGRGNRSFLSSMERSPRRALKAHGTAPFDFLLELRLIAQVALIGLPNVGKSTFLSKLSNSKVRIADYPFTTLEPHLGVVENLERWHSYVIADIPGLIEGSHRGLGLGTRFLKHIKRCKSLLFILDPSAKMSCWQQFQLLQKELFFYCNQKQNRQQSQKWTEKSYWIVFNKIDLFDSEELKKQKELFLSLFQKSNLLKENSFSSTTSSSSSTHLATHSTDCFMPLVQLDSLPQLFLASALKSQGLEEIKSALFQQ